jgi:hypothetical protein
MQSEKENAQLESMSSNALEFGFNPKELSKFFKDDFSIEESIELLGKVEHNYMVLYLETEDNYVYRRDIQYQVIFLRILKEKLGNAIGLKRLVS